MKGIVIGKEEMKWRPQGATEERVSRKLHVVWDAPKRVQDGFEGRRVETVYCPFDFKDIPLGSYCEFEYDVRPSAKGGNVARLEDIAVLCMCDILLEPLKQ